MNIKKYIGLSFFILTLNLNAQVNQPKKSDQNQTKIVNTIDTICGMKVDQTSKHKAIYKKKTYGFCSASCKEEFKKHPKKYVK